jgi:hypothetical protein
VSQSLDLKLVGVFAGKSVVQVGGRVFLREIGLPHYVGEARKMAAGGRSLVVVAQADGVRVARSKKSRSRGGRRQEEAGVSSRRG